MQSYAYKPVKFFTITLLATLLSGFMAAYFSFQKDMQAIQFLLMVPGLLSPFITALIMIYGSKNKDLVNPNISRLIQEKSPKVLYTKDI